MSPDIKKWCIDTCRKYGFSSFYLPNKDVYMIHFKGRAITGFNSKVFYQMPKIQRAKQLTFILKLGLLNNIEEKNRDTLYTKKRLGKVIYA